MLVVYGAGSVGLVVGARLARAGERVLFVTRRPEVAERIQSEGVRLEDPASGEAFDVRVEAVGGVEDAAASIGDGPVLFCMRNTETVGAAEDLARVAPRAAVANAQNGVHGEARLARHFGRVTGIIVRQTCTRTADNAAAATGAGRVVLGRHPTGTDDVTLDLAERFGSAGYEVAVSEQIERDRWLKLCVNLMSAPNALVRREDHTTAAFVEIKARVLEEARKVLDANGITAASCDGRDRSLEEEISAQREALAAGTSARTLPLYNQVWSSLSRGDPLEADGHHRLLLDLAARKGVAAPMNERVLDALVRVWRGRHGPESISARELLGEELW